jgi:hypothetical protein
MHWDIEDRDLLVIQVGHLSILCLAQGRIIKKIIPQAVPDEGLHIIIADNPNTSATCHGTLYCCVLNCKIVRSNGLKAIVPRKVEIQRLTCYGDHTGKVESLL